MFDSLKTRLIVIGILVVLAVIAIWPRSVTIRVQGEGGAMRDTTVRQLNLRRGLDLQGGIYLALELDESRGKVANKADAIDRALKVIRTRIDEFGVTEPLVQRQGSDRVVVQLAGISDPERARSIVERSAFLEFQMTDKQSLFRTALPAIDRALSAAGVSEASVGRAVAADSARRGRPGEPAPAPASTSDVEQLLGGATDTGKAAQGATKAPARTDTSAARRDTAADTLSTALTGPLSPLLFQGNMPGEFYVAEEKVAIVDEMLRRPEASRLMPRGIIIRWGAEKTSRGARAYRPLYALEQRQIMTGEYLTDAVARLDPIYNQAVVDFTLSRRGGRIFERETGRRVGDNMAIVLDGRVFSAPVLESQIGARGQIKMGSSTLQDAQDLAMVLKAGALPAPLQVVDQRTIGPSLGKDSISKGITAGIVGTLLVIFIMVGYYRFSGVLAVLGLGFYVLLTLGGLAAIGATLTLPGIAGFVLSIGIAVDANVLIFERIREELQRGKSVRLAIDAGFKMAMNAIVDSNVSTILTAAFLFQFGTGPVKGFAVTLILGILASMVTAIFVVRTFYMIYLARKKQVTSLSI